MDLATLQEPARFNRDFSESGAVITQIGTGERGGKSTGLQVIHDLILPRVDHAGFEGFTVTVPTFTVLATDLFDAFVERNRLAGLAAGNVPDDRIANAFQRAELPAELVGDLRALIAHLHRPIAVRSSSLLEDHLDHPFAGVYATKMIPNNEIEEDARFRHLVEAVKFVYASTYFAPARDYRRSLGIEDRSESMAVIIQEVVGQRAADRFYPCISGVGRSYNFYPTGKASADEGVVHLALGLGKTIVDGGLAWSFSPKFPAAPPPFNNTRELLQNTQTTFWAVNMGEPPLPDPIRETECLVQTGLAEAEADGALKFLASTYEAGSDRLYPGLSGRGPRALTFAPLLGSRFVPFSELVAHVIELCRETLGSHVEIEFAARLHRSDLLPARFCILQVRPMKVGGGDTTVAADELEREGVIVASTRALGNGHYQDIEDIVYVRPQAFAASTTRAMVGELEAINRSLIDQRRHYILIGLGRWGTSDERLGVPAAWGQISGARAIVEARTPEVNTDLSQGSHFFHNVLSFQVLYLEVEHCGPGGIDWDWLDRQPAVTESALVRHVRPAVSLTVRVDGASRRGVITRDG
jgi:hypothetical protein